MPSWGPVTQFGRRAQLTVSVHGAMFVVWSALEHAFWAVVPVGGWRQLLLLGRLWPLFAVLCHSCRLLALLALAAVRLLVLALALLVVAPNGPRQRIWQWSRAMMWKLVACHLWLIVLDSRMLPVVGPT